MTGVFVDWTGKVRSVDSPGKGLKCFLQPRNHGRYGISPTTVEVGRFDELENTHEIIFEADYYDSIEDLQTKLPQFKWEFNKENQNDET